MVFADIAIIIGIASFMAGEAIQSAYEVLADKPYITPIALISIIALIWWYLSAKTKK